MGLHQQVVFTCDQCDKHFTLGNEMELPPNWIGLQLAIADSDGDIPSQERELYSHFCSIECLSEYIDGDEIKERLYFADRPDKDEEDD